MGCNSSEFYKIYNNELLDILQKSSQGVHLGGGLVVSAVGQADDMCLLSNDIHSLHNLLHLALKYCEKYHVQLCSDKTKLVVFAQKWKDKISVFNPISINGEQIPFSNQAEHVGVTFLTYLGGFLPIRNPRE